MEKLPVADTAGFIFIQACGIIPLVGTAVAAIAQNIIDLAAKARHNQAACKYISERVKENLEIIARAKNSQRSDTEKSIERLRKTYGDVLEEINQYMIEIDKPGEFTKKVKKWLMETANANDVEEASEHLLQKLRDATDDFYKSVSLNINDQVVEVRDEMCGMRDEVYGMRSEMREIHKMSEAAYKIMLTQKGGESVTDIKDLQLKPDRIEDCEKSETRENIIKRVYIKNTVAVKKLLNPDFVITKIAKQAKIISLLSACDHIEKFFGIYEEITDGKNYLFVVTKWMEKGNLREYLTENKSIPWSTKLNIAEQIALGLEFCNSANVYHRDVRSKNVLLNEHLNAKLTNFEMSRKFGDASNKMPIEALRWTAPEKLRYPTQPYTDKCEVYSFAVVLWEVSSHLLPFGDIDSPVKAGDMVKEGKRPSPFSGDTPERYKEIVEQAWHHDHKKRPTIDVVRKELEKVKIITGDKRKKPTRSDTLDALYSMESTKYVPDDLEDAPLQNINKVISLHDNKQYKEAFPHFLRLAREGDASASYYAGLYLFEGTYEGIEKDEIQALQLFQKSADGGDARCQYMYAYACLKGSYYSKEDGLKNLKKAALIKKQPDALYMVSQLFLNGEHGYPVNNDKYMEYLKMAAERGSKEAKKELKIQEDLAIREKDF